MSTFVMLGRMPPESMQKISPKRTTDALELVKKHGGKLISGYTMLGQYDLLLVLELPTVEQAMKLSVSLARMLGISLVTSPAITFEQFDKIMVEE